MKFKLEKKYIQIGVTIFLTAVAILLFYFLLFRLDTIKHALSTINNIMAPIFYGFILAYLITPLLNTLENKLIIPIFKKCKWDKKERSSGIIRIISVTLSIIIVLLFFYLFFAAVIPELYKSLQSIVSQYSTYSQNLINWTNDLADNNPEIAKFMAQSLSNYSSEVDDWLNDIVMPQISNFLPDINIIIHDISASMIQLLKFLWNIVIGLVISIYVLNSKEKFAANSTKMLYSVLETQNANKLLVGVRFTHKTFIGFLSGKVLDSIIIGIITFICLSIMRMPYPILISVIVGITNIIPFFGPWLGAIPSTILIIMINPLQALYFVIFIFILQQIDGNVIGPKILSSSTGLTSFWIIFAITVFGGLFGIPGMIVGVPILAIIFTGVKTYTESKLRSKNLPVDSETYSHVGEILSDGTVVRYVYLDPHEENQKETKKKNKKLKGIKDIDNDESNVDSTEQHKGN